MGAIPINSDYIFAHKPRLYFRKQKQKLLLWNPKDKKPLMNSTDLCRTSKFKTTKMFFNNINNRTPYNCFKNNLYFDYILKRIIEQSVTYILIYISIFYFEKYVVEQITRFSFYKNIRNNFVYKNEYLTTTIIVTVNIFLTIYICTCEII